MQLQGEGLRGAVGRRLSLGGRQVCDPRSLDGCEAAESLDNKDSVSTGLVERLVKHQSPTGQYKKFRFFCSFLLFFF